MKELRSQLVSALLVILTAAALVAGAVNFQQQKLYHLPDDGVTWVDRDSGVIALYIAPDSGADSAGLKEGDLLLKINNYPIKKSIDASRVLARVGPWQSAEYVVARGGIELKAKVVVRERLTESSLFYLYAVGLSYLVIGLFVYFRRARARHAAHFYILCLASFVFFTFHYTGKLNNFDKAIYWGNLLAGLYAPTLFLHFCLTFPDPKPWFRQRRAAILLYVPATIVALVYFGMASGVLRTAVPLGELRWLLDRVWLGFVSAVYLIGAGFAWWSFRTEKDPVTRQQLKWLRNGAVYGVLPFTLLNTIPYLMGVVPGFYMNLAVLPLLLVPASWAYAILRYRLMDVDVIFQQGFTYTLATLAVMGLFYMLVLSKGPIEEMNPSTVALLLMVATFIFQPLRNWIQEILDRYVFYKDRYDYRRTLVEFARELSSETDLDAMLMAVADRLRRTLFIRKVAFFLANEGQQGYELTKYIGDDWGVQPFTGIDLSFLTPEPAGTLFFERTRLTLDVVTQHLPASVRNSVSRLDLTYYVPCQVRGRTIAYLGASRSDKGEFLSSEDLELLETLSGYVGIAIENARLYRSLQEKVVEYERLKEFSENIVESINVGIVAADLDDRVESWNSQMETLTGIARDRATGQRLAHLFPALLMEQLTQVDAQAGVHQLYKVPIQAQAWQPAYQESMESAMNGNGHHGGLAVAVAAVPQTSERLVNVAIAPLVTKEGDQIGRLIIFDDVTERAELEQRLVQTDKLSSIGLLAAGVAHEVNTPLAVISTYAQMLTKQISGDDPKSKLLEKIAKQTFRASEIVNSLLNFSRTSKTEFEEVDLNRVVRETLSLIEHQLEKAGVRVDFTPSLQSACVRGNFGKLQQVFLNLFLNARDAMETGGRLRVSTRTDDEHAQVEVADSGRGIAPEDLPRIYDPFFTTKGAKKGTGLGLAVTYGIVREHGGTINVKSLPGDGATFVVDLPLARKPVNA